MSQSLEHEHLLAPVTALAHCNGFVFAAYGQCLRIYEHESGNIAFSSRIFDDQTIHGVVSRAASDANTDVIVWGGHRLRHLKVHVAANEIGASISVQVADHAAQSQDWIFDVTFSSASLELSGARNQGYLGILITAHNALYAIGRATKEAPGTTFTALKSSSRGILYSANLSWLSESKVLIAAGTAFGEIIVWSFDFKLPQEFASLKHYVFTAHEGSIFGLHISSDLSDYRGKYPQRLLASCSDDRTVRVWDISQLESSLMECVSKSALDAHSDDHTGFATSDVNNVSSPQTAQPLAVAMGHISRIWNVRFISKAAPGGNDDQVNILSVGEDATCQRWTLEGRTSYESASTVSAYVLKHEETFAGHDGKNIWALATFTASSGAIHALTGAVDGQIIDQVVVASEDEPSRPIEIDFGTACIVTAPYPEQSPPKSLSKGSFPAASGVTEVGKRAMDAFRSYALVSDATLLLTTNHGHVNLVPLPVSEENRQTLAAWSYLGSFADMKGYAVVASVPKANIAVFAGSTGHVYAYGGRSRLVTQVTHAKAKVAGLFAQPGIESCEKVTVELIVTYMGKTKPTLCTIARNDEGGIFETVKESTISIPDGRTQLMVSSALLVMTVDGTKALFLGARDGNILAQYLGNSKSEIVHIHGLGDAITGLSWVAGRSDHGPSGWLFAAGRDGFLKVYELGKQVSDCTLVHCLALPFGPNLEGLTVDASRGTLSVHGFHSTKFFVYDVVNDQTAMSVECGGAHRTWAFEQSSEYQERSGECKFVWTKAGRLYAHLSRAPSHRVLQSGGHGRDIKACAVSPVPILLLDGRSHALIATGAEDTNIRLFTYSSAESSNEVQNLFRCVATLRKHNTGIHHLQWSEDGTLLFSCGGFEEFFVWHVRSVPIIGVGVVCEAVCPTNEALPDLRVMSFAAAAAAPELNDLSAEEEEKERRADKAYTIAMVFSDSSLKVWRYTSSSTAPEWTLLRSASYLSACLTQVNFIFNNHFLLTSATDGHIAVWSLQDLADAVQCPSDSLRDCAGSIPNQWMVRRQIHQSAIKALSLARLTDSSYLCVTGGDDNGVGFSLIRKNRLDAKKDQKLLKLFQIDILLIPRAHAAAVTACAISVAGEISDECSNHNYRKLSVVTASNDQRVKLWQLSIDTEKPAVDGIQVRKGSNCFTPVADAATMDLLKDPTSGQCHAVLVCGVGVEIWRTRGDKT